MPAEYRKDIPALLLGGQEINTVVSDFYKDISFSRDAFGNINLSKLYNLFTGSNKPSYIDTFLDKSVNDTNLVEQIKHGVVNKTDCWYLN